MRKSDNSVRLHAARKLGEQTAITHGFSVLPVDPFKIAERVQIIVQGNPDTAKGVSGMLLRHGENYGIIYATYVVSDGFQRFSVAHELGHYFLPGHIDHVLPPGTDAHSSHAGFSSGNIYELEADHFAAGLLMPTDLVRQAICKTRDGLEAITSLALNCGTSLPASAIRYVEITDCPAAIIMSMGQTIDYCFMSESLRAYRDDGFTWIRKGAILPNDSETASLNRNVLQIEQGHTTEAETDLADWWGGSKSILGIEQAIGLGQYGKTLTVLTFPNLPDEEEIEEEQQLIESLTPQFRR